MTNDNIPLVIPGRRDLLFIQVPFLIEDGKWIRRERFQSVIGTGEQKLCPARDGTKLADDQAIFVDRIVGCPSSFE
jgi:hypothetical protein